MEEFCEAKQQKNNKEIRQLDRNAIHWVAPPYWRRLN